MRTYCISVPGVFLPVGRRRLDIAFDAGDVSSDGGALLLREVSQLSDFFGRIARCFEDYRDPSRIDHTIEELVTQRILGIACGYEDLNDHDVLRRDPLFALAAGKSDPTGANRRRSCDRGFALAGHATLNRLETAGTTLDDSRKDLKVLHDPEAFERLLVDLFLDAHDSPPQEIVLDFDATDDHIHGMQEGRFFHGYYRYYCYLPLYVFCGDFLLVSKLRTSGQDGAAGALDELKRLVARIRSRWPRVRIVVRGDSGFCRDWLMTWCDETPGVDYVLGLAKNPRLLRYIEDDLEDMARQVERTGQAARTFRELRYQTRDSWSRERRVVAKAEVLTGKSNPRFVVTSLPIEELDSRALYEDLYCARGDMENRIKEQQLGMFADRTSSHTMRANQLRLWFSSLAYILVNELRAVALVGTELARAQVWTIRVRLFKVGALFKQSVRRIKIALSSAYPLQEVWAAALRNIQEVREDIAM